MQSPASPPLDPFYYLGNFSRALDWVCARYDHLLADEERRFAAQFPTLPLPARALLVRMAMRKGTLFRHSKLRYVEIGATEAAVRPLAEAGWVELQPALALDEVFALLTKPELVRVFGLKPAQAALPKNVLYEALCADQPAPRALQAWWEQADDHVYRLLVDPICARLRLLFFGNGWQDWSEFVLADLGIYRYETVELGAHAHAFRSREDIALYLQIHDCRQKLEQGEPPASVLAAVPEPVADHPWLEGRRARLLFALGQQCERDGKLEDALAIYARCAHAGARQRRVRMLERLQRCEEAWELAQQATAAPESEAERQQLERMLPRLRRRIGLPQQAAPVSSEPARIDLVLPPCGERVELAAAAALATPAAPVHYVENGLLNALLGLLCWRAVYAPVPGAFFHPFQSGPADLHSADFVPRRTALFAACLAALDDGSYIDCIRRTWSEKAGLVSPFVPWDLIDGELLERALSCLPAAHLKACFTRMLFDLKANCSGLPDLIQFFPAERSYRLIEVKGPGDRLQDNQLRWLDHFAAHRIPVAVCHVRWEQPA